MTQTAIFWPMIAHVVLVAGIYIMLMFGRKAAVRAGDARLSQFRENRDEPAQSLFIRNNLANQFELPVLFHAACLALFVTGGAGPWAVALAWLFAVSRYAHTAIHVTSDRIRYRQPAFTVGFLALLALWALLAVHLLRG